eukprot:NODE_20_length_44879_cov_0.624654.p30 type:complete len:199 gc:universal NODE_20_length_44879_cov_0.624654:38319-38915(+)
MRLSVPVLENALTYQNPLKEDTIDLDRLGIIDSNISITDDVYRCVNLQRNIMTKIIVPSFERLTTLLLAHNKLQSVHIKAPNLRILSLNSNAFRDIEEIIIDSLKLENLTLYDTPLESIKQYRILVCRRFRNLRVLDYEKVRLVEKQDTSEINTILQKVEPKEDKILSGLKKQLVNANTMDEIQQIEKLILLHKQNKA